MYPPIIFDPRSAHVLIFSGLTANKEAASINQKKKCKYISNLIRTPLPLDTEEFYKFCIAYFKENPESQKVKNIND